MEQVANFADMISRDYDCIVTYKTMVICQFHTRACRMPTVSSPH